MGDGDSKAFPTISELMPYDPHFQVQKLECVNHIQKRMRTGVRKKKKKERRGVKLDHVKGIRGCGHLSNEAIDKIQTIYGLGIRRNASYQQEVWATYFHLAS